MDTPKMLSGEELVTRGVTKSFATLPEIGLKDVTPNGSWLEQKQIQAALEARKHLIEVERIEKLGTLSQAEWRDDLKLAEVTKQAGSHWQFFGHNVGKKLYLRCEEALFLMEVNCLQLKHNEVTVSIQKAYSLLLDDSFTINQYKVYASLSRLGYKVFRHREISTVSEKEKDFESITAERSNNDGHANITKDVVHLNKEYSPSTTTEKADRSSAVMEENKTLENTTDSQSTVAEEADGKIAVKKEINTVQISADGPSISIEKANGYKDVVEKNSTAEINTDDPSTTTEKTDDNNAVIEGNRIVESITDGSATITEKMDKNTARLEDNSVPHILTEALSTVAEKADGNNDVMDENTSVEITTDGLSTTTENIVGNNVVMEENSTVKSTTDKETTPASIIIDAEGKTHVDVYEKIPNIDETRSKRIRKDNETECPLTIDRTCDYVNGNKGTDQNSVVNGKKLHNNNSREQNTNTTEGDTEQRLENIEVSQDSRSTNTENIEHNNIFRYEIKIQRLQNRKFRAIRNISNFFEELPEMAKQDMIYINTPEDFYIPKNIYVNKTTYQLNLENIKAKNCRSSSAESKSYSSSDEEDQSLRRIRNTSRSETPQNSNMTQFYPHMRLPRINQQFRPFLFWRPQPHFIHFNTFHPRPFFQSQFLPRLNFNTKINSFLRPYPNMNMLDSNNDNDTSFPRAPKRPKNAKQLHLQAVKNLATKVKNHILSGNMVMPGNTHIQTIQALHKLLYTYNIKFNSRLRLTPQFDLIDEPNVVETIELDADEEIKNKKPRIQEDTFNENLNKLRQIALKLKNLEVKGISTSRHRRALSSAIKSFNKSYNAEVYLNDNYELIDRRHITLESSSDNDCVVKETKKRQKKKKLRNPFYILKKRSESQNNGHASTSKDNSVIVKQVQQTIPSRDNQFILDKTNAHWLPKDDDFGRVEMCPKNGVYTCLMNNCEDQFLYDFLKSQTQNYGDWVEVKIAFIRYLKEINKQYETEHKRTQALTPENQSGICSIIGREDCSDTPTLLKKLRIIKTNKTVNSESNIKIDFDVYNRDVPNFRKTNRPKPHFRIVCYNVLSPLPTGADIGALNAKYEDGIAIVFAIVDAGSISYLQIKPTELPVYLPTNLQ